MCDVTVTGPRVGKRSVFSFAVGPTINSGTGTRCLWASRWTSILYRSIVLCGDGILGARFGSTPYFVGTFMNFLNAVNLTTGELPGCLTPQGRPD